MIEQKQINLVITKALNDVTGCEVVKANLAHAPIPPYPYLSFSIIRTETRKGTYSVEGNRYISLTQTWSITVQGKNDDETLEKAIAAHDWLEEAGRLTLQEQGIVIQHIGAIQNRDTLLTVNYEYRKGFDVVLSLINIIQEEIEVIEQANIERT